MTLIKHCCCLLEEKDLQVHEAPRPSRITEGTGCKSKAPHTLQANMMSLCGYAEQIHVRTVHALSCVDALVQA